MKLKRNVYCGAPRMADIGKNLTVCGWTQRQRDLGGLIFIDLRDRSGILQLAFDDETDRKIFEMAASARSEYVLAARGTLRERSSKNMEIPTGEVELFVTELEILAVSETPPFEIVEDTRAGEALRLKHRYLDLRRPDLQQNILLRHRVTKVTRDYFDEQGFVEIETPILIRSTPEGARDYLVPSRLRPGNFYALPQSPQLYKQLSMVAGFDRYIQIARCFRDEDLRADRQPVAPDLQRGPQLLAVHAEGRERQRDPDRVRPGEAGRPDRLLPQGYQLQVTLGGDLVHRPLGAAADLLGTNSLDQAVALHHAQLPVERADADASPLADVGQLGSAPDLVPVQRPVPGQRAERHQPG